MRGLKIQMILTTQSKKMGKSVGIYPMIVIYCWNCNLDHEDQFGDTKTSICYCQLLKLQNVLWGIIVHIFIELHNLLNLTSYNYLMNYIIVSMDRTCDFKIFRMMLHGFICIIVDGSFAFVIVQHYF